MLRKEFSYPLSYKLNYIPGICYILFFLILIKVLPSTTKLYGYSFFVGLLIYFIILVLRERAKIAKIIVVDDSAITAEKYGNNVYIKWDDVVSLHYGGKGLYLVSWKLVKYLFAEVISRDGEKIVIRREINGYDELIQLIEMKTGKVFSV